MSYVTNPIANRLGIQQGWFNPLISLHSGLTNTSFITYLKCYLLMQEYLRYNQMNLVFFEIKPLQKNKKLIHLFVYKNILHLEKNELEFNSRLELKKNSFLQISMYLRRSRLKLNKFKSRHSISKFICNSTWKNKSVRKKLSALNPIIKFNYEEKKNKKLQRRQKRWQNFQKNDKMLWAAKQKSKIKNKLLFAKAQQQHLKNLPKVFFGKLKHKDIKKKDDKNFAKNFALGIYKFQPLGFDFSSKQIPNFRKKIKYYKKKKLARKILTYHFKNRQNLKRRYKSKKRWPRYSKKPINRQFLKLQKNKQNNTEKKFRKIYQSTEKRIFLRKLNKKKIFKISKLFRLHRKYTATNKNFKSIGPVALRKLNSKFSTAINNFIFNQKKPNKNKAGYKFKNFQNKVIYMKNKKNYTTQYKNFRNFLKISKIRKLKYLAKSLKNLRKKPNKRKSFRKLQDKLLKNMPFPFFQAKPALINKKLVLSRAQLYFKNRAPFYNSTSPLLRYFSFNNTYQKHKKFSVLKQMKSSSWKTIKTFKKKYIKTKLHFRSFESKFQKLNFQFQFFIEKYIQVYLGFPIVAKIKNINDFVDLRSHQKTIDYTKHIFLKSVAGKNFFTRLLYLLLNSERVFNPQLFINLIASEMQKTNNYKKLVNNMIFMFSTLHSEHIMGYKILIDGKLGGSKGKSTKQIFKLQNKEKIPIQTFTKKVSYALGVARTPAGLFGIRMWLYY
jgi:hypothetical protein